MHFVSVFQWIATDLCQDLKPENLLLTSKPAQSDSLEGVTIKLADFGLAKRIPGRAV